MDLNLRQELAAVTARIAALGSTGDLAAAASIRLPFEFADWHETISRRRNLDELPERLHNRSAQARAQPAPVPGATALHPASNTCIAALILSTQKGRLSSAGRAPHS